VEVPAGNPTTCSPGYGMYLHVSQAALGDSKGKPGKAQERVVVKVSVEPHNEIVLGTLVEGKCDQMHLDLVFDRDFTISHTGKTSSVYICGYRTEAPEEEDDDDEFDDEDEDEEEKDAPVPTAVPIVNGSAEAKSAKAGKSDDGAKSAAAKATDKAANTIATAIAKVVEKTNSKKQVVDDDDDSEEDDESEDEGLEHPFLEELASESDDEFDAGDDSDEDMEDDDDEDDDEDDDDEDDSDESEEEELKTPEVKAGKKRSAAQPVKAAEKKAKTEASPKPEQVSVNGKKGKKSTQATPEKKEAAPKTPTDKAVKPAKAPKGTPTAPPPTPVSAKKIGDHKCTGCERTFTTESALSQHTAAKHK